ncbi:hypothetical protein PR202_ga11622 [Eleusine coracana subsp. coracana]|uniref:Uncharacterized protein n=1 Tax=Eleusine coracana subsp. coracana TaxID=191504 RepID=A0AAV5C9Y0_ELECO|nr:hypothetical protein PR202_ga11622 [Eleusine coracana subsp. coracana]
MLRRAATLLSRRTAAAPFLRHAKPELGGAPLVPRLGTGPGPGGGARGYARMARRLPPARPDGYSTSDVESDLRALEDEDLEPRAGGVGGEEEDGEDSEGSEMEGFMFQHGSGSDSDGEDDDEEKGAAERDR